MTGKLSEWGQMCTDLSFERWRRAVYTLKLVLRSKTLNYTHKLTVKKPSQSLLKVHY